MMTNKPKVKVKNPIFLYILIVLVIITVGVSGSAASQLSVFIYERTEKVESPKFYFVIAPEGRSTPSGVYNSNRLYRISAYKSESVGASYNHDISVSNYETFDGVLYLSEMETFASLIITCHGSAPCKIAVYHKLGVTTETVPILDVDYDGSGYLTQTSTQEYFFPIDSLPAHNFRLNITYPNGVNINEQDSSMELTLTWRVKK